MATTTFAGRFDFEDGGTYCGGWEDGKAHGFGVCTGPKSMGEFSGMWQFGYEVSGVYLWPSGNCFLGQWMSGKRHGLGVEKKQRWIYKGEWSQGFKGRYGVRMSEISGAKYEGTWANGLQDGYGSETYADGGTFFGQMSQGMRNGYGIRKSISYAVASRYRSKDIKDSLTSLRSEEGDERLQRERDRRFDENRGGFVLRARVEAQDEAGVTLNQATSSGNLMTNAINGLFRRRRNSFQSQAPPNQDNRRVSLRKTLMTKLKKQKSVGDIDEVNTIHSGSHAANLNTLTTSSGRAQKKSSFRSTSSNNSVDSRASNRTAPAGIGLNSPSLGGHMNNQMLPDDDGHSFVSQDEITDVNCIEVYMGEWKQDKRTGYGIAERSDGLKYEGEWFNNKKNGYGVTTFKDGTKEEGKYKNNVLITDKKKGGKLLMLRSNKLRQKIDAAVNCALKAGQIAQQRADIALARAVNARTKAFASEIEAKKALGDSEFARVKAREVAPDFVQPGELKKFPEIIFEIDRMGNSFNYQSQLLTIADPVNPNPNMNNISPNEFRKMHQQQHKPMMEPYRGGNGPGNEQFINRQQNSIYHSSTPPPIQPSFNQRLSNNNLSNQIFYDQNLISPSLLQQQQQQQQQQNLHPSIDLKLNNELMGMNHIDAQTLAHLHHPQQNYPQQNKHLFQQNYSFDEATSNSYYDRMNLLKQAQSNSFNMELLNSVNQPTNEMLRQQEIFQRNNPKRNTLKRTQNVIDNSIEELRDQGDLNLMGLTPQQLLLMRQQQYSNNSSGQESGLGSSVYTNSAHGTLDLLQNLNNQKNNLSPNHGEKNKETTQENNLQIPPVQIPRRKSLPSIVKTKSFKEDEVAHSSSELNNKNQDIYIIENGIRKRVTEKSNSALQQNKLIEKDNDEDNLEKSRLKTEYDYDDETPQLPRKIILESVNSLVPNSQKTNSKRVSMPSIPAYLSPKFANKIMSREEANRLSSLRREELRKNRELESNRTLRLKKMLQDVFLRNRVFLFIILFNISLAIWFLQMLK
ncbi:unnamed protein product [Brachionus calyciflorus]|uniref:Junctophilin n=1 Tax=Brachionus calyciflorus TaxID=104777 RepID=A0A813M2R6_9BILA|nr:unnamed protein product [Brachionus calyciflorus]